MGKCEELDYGVIIQRVLLQTGVSVGVSLYYVLQ